MCYLQLVFVRHGGEAPPAEGDREREEEKNKCHNSTVLSSSPMWAGPGGPQTSPAGGFELPADADVNLHGLEGPLFLWLDALENTAQGGGASAGGSV